MKRRTGQRGHTVVEVLIAAGVAAVGFAAVFSLQMGSMLANISARDMTAAMTLGERYVDVLRRDSFAWVGETRPAPRLNQQSERWHSFSEFAIDQNGLVNLRDEGEFGSALNRQRFCVHYWLAPMDGLYAQMMNVRVRVIWPRNSLDASQLTDVCPEENANGFRMNSARWYSITIPSVLRSSDES